MVLKNKCFFDFDFLRFFAIFNDFGLILGGPGPSKNYKKLKKNRTNRFFNASSFEEGFWEGSGKDFGTIF